MKRFLYCLGAAAVLAGASLMLPVVASAQPTCDSTPTGFSISETPQFNITGELYGCFISGNILAPASVDLTQTSTIASDQVNLANVGTATGVTLVSDTTAGGFALRSDATPIAETATASGDGAFISAITLGTPYTLTVNSDVGADVDVVPEPPTGLLMGVAGMLPFALTYLKRRGTRGQPSAA
jgi:hypothetical protein